MISVLPSKQKPQKLLSKVLKNGCNTKQRLFLRSYSELLNRHFNQSTREKSQLRKNSQQKHGLRPSTRGQRRLENNDTQVTVENQQKEINFLQNYEQSLNLKRKISENKLNPSQILRRSELSRAKFQLNPQANDKIQHMIMSKTSQLQKNSYENVILSNKLCQARTQKNDLLSLVKTLEMEILKQKKYKSNISTKMAKLMNKIQLTNTFRKKNQTQRMFINQQIETLTGDIELQIKRNNHLQLISSSNQEKISIEKQLIKELEGKIEQQKNSHYQTKVYLNEFKPIYMQQSKCLRNTKTNFGQALAERQKFFNDVQSSVRFAKSNFKS